MMESLSAKKVTKFYPWIAVKSCLRHYDERSNLFDVEIGFNDGRVLLLNAARLVGNIEAVRMLWWNIDEHPHIEMLAERNYEIVTDRAFKSLNLRLIGSTIALCASLYFLLPRIETFYNFMRIEQNGIRQNAKVVEKIDGSFDHHIAYQYTYLDKAYEGKSEVVYKLFTEVPVGSEISILVDKNRPSQSFIYDSPAQGFRKIGLLGAPFIVFVFAAWYGVRAWWRSREF